MFKVQKKATRLHAYRLGDPHPVLDRLIAEGGIVPQEDGMFEILSLEAAAGGSGKGELAKTGDYIKLSLDGVPYPNAADFFLANHRKVGEDEYEQVAKPLQAWSVREPMCDEIRFLIDHKDLVINEDDEQKYFTAPLWGTVESAAKDSVIIFYSIDRDENGGITDAAFNFVIRGDFDKTYDVVE